METSTEQTEQVTTETAPVNPGVVTVPEVKEPEAEVKSEAPAEAPKPKAGEMPEWMKERLRKNAEQKRQKDEEIARLTAENRRYAEEVAKLKPPTQDQFQTLEEFQAALTAHHVRRGNLDSEQARVSDQLQSAQGDAQRAQKDMWASRVDQARLVFPDFDAVTQAAATPASSQLLGAIANAPNGAIAMYILSKNPQEIHRLNTMAYPEILQEFIRIEDRFVQSRQNAAPPKPPIKPVGGSGVPAAASTYKEWEAEANRKRGLY